MFQSIEISSFSVSKFQRLEPIRHN